jgi:hypothetical protein
MIAKKKKPGRVWRLIRSSVLLFLCLAAAAFSQTDLNPPDSAKDSLMAAQLLDISMGIRAKVVWERRTTIGGAGFTSTCVLAGFDTYDKKERIIQSEVGEYVHPFLTHDGTRVIWNAPAKSESWISNWDGTGKTLLFKGDTATHPAWVSFTRWDSVGKQDYIYAGVQGVQAKTYFEKQHEVPRVYSYPLNGLKVDTTQRRVVWDSATAGSGLCGVDWFSLSADGLYAAGEMSDGINCLGFLDLAQQKIIQTRSTTAGPEGCEQNSAPDNSRMWMHFMAGHSWIHLYKYAQNTDLSFWCVPYPKDSLDNIKYHTWPASIDLLRWSNHPRFITLDACIVQPTDTTWNMQNFHNHIYLERFDAGFTKIEKFIQVDHSPFGYAAFDCSAWFDLSGKSSTVPQNHLAPTIGKTGLSINHIACYDIQGRRITASSVQLRKISASESKGLYIEHGQLLLMAR